MRPFLNKGYSLPKKGKKQQKGFFFLATRFMAPVTIRFSSFLLTYPRMKFSTRKNHLWHLYMERKAMTQKVEIFTDGACKGNPGPGGWGVILRYQNIEKELSGFEPMTTNNRMELRAAIEGIKALKRSVKIDIYTDSQYLRYGITKWLVQWKAKNWRLSNRDPVKNQDLWEELDALTQNHNISWHWVRGHTGHIENERADALARYAIKKALKANN